MRIAVIGSAGHAGSLITTEARNRGHEVVGFGRTNKPGVDYAIAMVDEAENAAHPRQRISVHA